MILVVFPWLNIVKNLTDNGWAAQVHSTLLYIVICYLGVPAELMVKKRSWQVTRGLPVLVDV